MRCAISRRTTMLSRWRSGSASASARSSAPSRRAPARRARGSTNSIRYKLRYVLAVRWSARACSPASTRRIGLARAFLPDPGPLLGDQEMAIEAWVTPADYTHAAPVSLSDLVGRTRRDAAVGGGDGARHRPGRRAAAGVRWPAAGVAARASCAPRTAPGKRTSRFPARDA